MVSTATGRATRAARTLIMGNKRVVRIGVGLLCAAVFAALIVRQTSVDALRTAFAGATFWWVVVGFGAFAGGYASRIARWRLMLLADNPALTWRACAGPLLGSFAINNVVPLRAGDVLRTFAFCDRLGVSSGTVLASLFVERLLDLLLVLLLLGAALWHFKVQASVVAGVGSVALLLLALGIILLLLCPGLFAPVAAWTGTRIERVAPRAGLTVRLEIDKAMRTLKRLAHGGTMLRLLAWSAAAWLGEGLLFCCAALALPSVTQPAAAWLALPVGTLATLIPGTPGYIGTFDYFAARALALGGNDAAAATAFALLVHAMLWLPPTLVGGLYLIMRPPQPSPAHSRPS